MTLTGMFDPNLRHPLWDGQIQSYYSSRKKHVRTRISPAPVLKPLRLVLKYLTLFQRTCEPLKFFVLNNVTTSVPLKSIFSEFQRHQVGPSRCRVWYINTVIQSSVAWLVTSEDAIQGSSTSNCLRFVQSGHTGLLLDVKSGARTKTISLFAGRVAVRLCSRWGSGLP